MVVGGIAARLAGIKGVVSAIAGLGYAFTGERGGWLAFVLRALVRVALVQGPMIVQNPDDARAVRTLGVAAERIRLIAGAGVDTERCHPEPETQGCRWVACLAALVR